MTSKTQMQFQRVETTPGQYVLRLTSPWAGLPVGAEVKPLLAGWNNATGRRERVVMFNGGRVVGPY